MRSSLDPEKSIAKWAALGLAAGVVLPGLGFIMGGLIGGGIGAMKGSDEDIKMAREKLDQLMEELASGFGLVC